MPATSFKGHYYALKSYEGLDIEYDMKVVAIQFPTLSGGQILEPEIGERFARQYYRELIWLLELLKASTERSIKMLTSPPGPKINEALEGFVRKVADFWVLRLNQRFSVYHRKRDDPRTGDRLTPAFKFIRALVAPLDDISDNNLVTAMRKEITWRRKSGEPTGA